MMDIHPGLSLKCLYYVVNYRQLNNHISGSINTSIILVWWHSHSLSLFSRLAPAPPLSIPQSHVRLSSGKFIPNRSPLSNSLIVSLASVGLGWPRIAALLLHLYVVCCLLTYPKSPFFFTHSFILVTILSPFIWWIFHIPPFLNSYSFLITSGIVAKLSSSSVPVPVQFELRLSLKPGYYHPPTHPTRDSINETLLD